MNVTKRNIDLQGGLGNPIKMVVQDHNSRFLKITLTNEGRAFNLSEKQVFIGTSGTLSGEEYNIENEGIINDPYTGTCTFEITSNMLPNLGCHDFQIIIREADLSRLTFPKFKIMVGEYITNEPLIVAENESSILDDLNEVNINLDECLNKVGDKDDEADTLFGKINTLLSESGLSYDEFRSRFTDLDTIIGEANPTVANTDTVMNYIKLLDFSTRDGWVKDKKDDLYSPNMVPEFDVFAVSEAQTGESNSIAVDDSFVYYSDTVSKKVVKMDKTDLSVVAVSEEQTGFTYSIAVDDSFVYYGDYTTKKVVKMDKTDLSVIAISEEQTGFGRSIVVDDSFVYSSGFSKNVFKMDKTDLSVVATSPTQTGLAYSSAVDDSFVYYADSDTKKVVKMDKTDLSVVATSEEQAGFSRSIAVDDSFVYYSDTVSKKVVKMDKTDLSVVAVSEEQTGFTYSIAVDDSFVYYVDYIGKTVIRMEKRFLSEIIRTPIQRGSTYGMVVDGTDIYYTDRTTLNVVKIGERYVVKNYTKEVTE